MLVPGVAVASEGESAFSVALSAATWWHDRPDSDDAFGPTAGGQLLVSYERGISSSWSLRVDLAGGLYGRDGLSWSAVVAGGIVYRFDVIRYVPYAFVEIGGVALGGGPLPDDDSTRLGPLVLAGIGIDMLRGRDSSWGFELRAGGLLGDANVATLGARTTWRWGYF